jgi:hypothetical protein
MSDIDTAAEQTWPRTCSACGTDLATAVVDFDKTNADRPELRPGEMAAVDYCPNPDCPTHAADAVSPDSGPATGPGSLGGDNGGA